MENKDRPTKKILVVDDIPDFRELMMDVLDRAGYQCIMADNAEQARLMIEEERPDIILLDWVMPGVSGVELLRYLKAKVTYAQIPIIMVTARDSEEDRLRVLEIGADDYIVKPFKPPVLVARIQALLNQGTSGADGTIRMADLLLDLKEQTVIAGMPPAKIDLGRIAFRILAFFMTNPDVIHGRDSVLKQVWGGDDKVGGRTVDVYVRHLRKALEPWGHHHRIETVRGSGYRFSSAAEVVANAAP
ncbi:MAG: response regulator [Magnetococcales bacterium]|nr:response regulator [Magnetococcales bacterium]MBF0151318.1 response regulator [Magnetococcales bacterium]MBF0174224.1 response regulator [Magnetococcales bacterium]MBF0347255.1 response regulator [Magnetococcales bacterium]MBF0632221.1 response regulator [Magnetococcales bacterium]